MNACKPIAEKPILHHVTLKTIKLEEMLAWYEAAVGCVANYRFPGGAWTTNDAANHRVAFLKTPALSDDSDKLRHTGIHHLAFEFGSLDALLANYARLAEANILPHICLDHGLTTSFYYVDPDGNSVELQCDNFGDWEKSSEWMRTSPDFAANPIGVEIDPPKMIAARAGGMPVAELHKRTRAGEFLPAQLGDIRLPV
ncbi:MAG: VOC family protein [Variibacter sp.]|nr:VOC family protein [Variibacter sp.]